MCFVYKRIREACKTIKPHLSHLQFQERASNLIVCGNEIPRVCTSQMEIQKQFSTFQLSLVLSSSPQKGFMAYSPHMWWVGDFWSYSPKRPPLTKLCLYEAHIFHKVTSNESIELQDSMGLFREIKLRGIFHQTYLLSCEPAYQLS